jgi:hypothetical protein
MTTYAIHAAPNISWQKKLAPIIQRGLLCHNIKANIVQDKTRVSDVSLILGPNAWKQIESDGKPFLMFNRKFLGFQPQDVHENVAISWDGFNGYGTFCVNEIDEKRLYRYVKEEEILDYRYNAHGVNLLCEQYDLGRCRNWKSINDFYSFVKKRYDNVVVRKKVNPENIGVEEWKRQILQQLQNVKSAHVLNSTVSTELTVFGVPLVSHDKGDPCYSLRNMRFKRMKLLNYLAHCQWHYDEINNGKWWEKLKNKKGPKLYEI